MKILCKRPDFAAVLLLVLPMVFCGCEQKNQLKAEIDSLRLQIEEKQQWSALAQEEFHQVQKQVTAVGSRQMDPVQLRKQIESNKADIEALKTELAAEQANLERKTEVLNRYRSKYYGKN